MKIFNPINREYVAPVDLGLLGNMYNTLEQGHHQAVRAASELETAMADLDLNEAESEWRYNKINEIKSTIQQNTLYGNSYGALDDIIAKAGDIYSDPGMIGRLNAQKDYKQYLAKLDARNDIPEEYKEYYKETNKYKYQDQYSKDGKVIGGTKWNPTEHEVSTVPLSDIIIKGINIAAKQSGGVTQTEWLDVEGNVTKDPTKAYDGQIYNQTTSSWQRLGRDKIMAGIKGLIESTPGAKASLDQDYKIAKWKHNKLSDNNKDGNIIISDITDDNGIPLTQSEYLSKRISPSVFAAEYNNVVNNTTYGAGLSSYIAGRKRISAEQNAITNVANSATIDGTNNPVEVVVDKAASAVATKNNTLNVIKQEYKRITGKDLQPKDVNNLDMGKLMSGYDIDPETKYSLNNLAMLYNESIKNLESFTENMDAEDKKAFDFAARMKSGGEIISGASKYDDKTIKRLKEIFIAKDKNFKDATVSTIKITIKDDSTKEHFLEIINGDNYTNYKNLGIQLNGNSISISKDNQYALPIIASALKQAASRRNNTVWGTIEGAVVNRYEQEAYDEHGNKLNYYTNNSKNIDRGSITKLESLANIYDESIELSKKLSNKYGVAPEKAIVSSLNFSGQSFEHGKLKELYDDGLISEQQYNINKKYLDDDFDLKLKGTAFTQLEMYVNDGKSSVRRKITNSKDRFIAGTEIQEAIKDKRATPNPTAVANVTDPISGAPIAGYNITIIPKVKENGTVVGDEYTKTYFIPGLLHEATSKQLMQSPKVQAYNAVQIVGATKTSRLLTDPNITPYLGSISYKGLDDNNFLVNYDGMQFKTNLDNTINLHEAVNKYKSIKNLYTSRAITAGSPAELKNRAERLDSALENSAKLISNTLGLDFKAIYNKMLMDLKE